MRKLRVGVMFGGRSGEHEVSVRSVRSLIEAMDPRKYEIVPIAITKEGKWLLPSASAKLLPESTAKFLPRDAAPREVGPVERSLNPSNSPDLFRAENGDDDANRTLDVVFPVLHGTYGEDGTIQGWLEMIGLPYVGCGVLASACGMDKVTMKALFREADLPVCNHTWFLRNDWESDRESTLENVARQIGFPCFVKPANLGSSVGISRAVDKPSLEESIELAARFDRKVIVEEGLDVREIECGVMGNDSAEASLPGEYVAHDGSAVFLDYTEKYSETGHVEFVVPAPLSKEMTAQVQRLAVRAFQAIDGSGLARVDFFLRRDTDELLVNELNTMPGLTEVSGFPKMWAASGLTFPHVIDRLVTLAQERHKEKSRNLTSL